MTAEAKELSKACGDLERALLEREHFRLVDRDKWKGIRLFACGMDMEFSGEDFMNDILDICAEELDTRVNKAKDNLRRVSKNVDWVTL